LATSSGGKTLLVPTPYAIKLALVDATIRAKDVEAGRRLFDLLRACPVGITPTRWACVTNTFSRVLRLHTEKGKKSETPEDEGPSDDDEGDDEGDADVEQDRPFKRTIAYREIAVLRGSLRIAVGLRGLLEASLVVEAGRHVNSFGRRGSFFQLIATDEVTAPDPGAVVVDPAGPGRELPVVGDVACLLDDTSPGAEFERVNTFSSEQARIGTERVLRQYLLPFRRVTSSQAFAIYERVDLPRQGAR
jgi:hypothetical protein